MTKYRLRELEKLTTEKLKSEEQRKEKRKKLETQGNCGIIPDVKHL